MTQKIKVKKLLDLAGISQDEFQKYNLDIKDSAFKKNAFLPKGYVVHIPKDVADSVVSKNKKLAQLVSADQALEL